MNWGDPFGIREKVMGVGLIVLTVALFGLFVFHNVESGMLQMQLKKANEDIGSLTVLKASQALQISTLTADLDKQNKAVEGLQKAAEERSAEAASAQAKVRQVNASWKKKYDGVLAQVSEAKDCEELSLRVDEYLSVRKSEVSP